MTEKLLNEDITRQITEVFNQLKEPVKILFFGQKADCDYCDDTRQLVEEVTALSDRLEIQVFDLQDDSPIASQYKVDKAPAIVITAKDGDDLLDYGIRFAGIPSGHEFTSLIQDLILVSGRDSGLGADTRQFLKDLSEPVRLQVFVTPTCPYCPRAVVLAHQMAMENPLVEAEAVEATEFPELSERYGVSGVPHTTINEGAADVIGAVPEAHLVAEIQRALGAG